LLGFGTWSAFGAGRVAVGFDGSNSLFNAAEKTGGNYDGSLLAHTHGFSGSTASAGSHTHTLNVNSIYRASDCCSYFFPQTNGSANSTPLNAISTAGDHTHTFSGTTASTGTAGTNTNVQPFITVYMWKRTA
jgi:microcystin-dependent protein